MYKAKTHTRIPFPCTNKIPHNLQPTESLKQTLGRRISILKMLSMYVPGKLNIFGHNCHPFCMYGAEVGVFQKPNQICLCSFLQTQKISHTWKHRSYLPTSRAISQTNCEKRHFQMRSSVLYWNWQILCRATIPSQYLQAFFSFPAVMKSFLGALPPTVEWSFFLAGSSLPDIDGLASEAIWANCQVSSDW